VYEGMIKNEVRFVLNSAYACVDLVSTATYDTLYNCTVNLPPFLIDFKNDSLCVIILVFIFS